jgi:hypothetical protein
LEAGIVTHHTTISRKTTRKRGRAFLRLTGEKRKIRRVPSVKRDAAIPRRKGPSGIE